MRTRASSVLVQNIFAQMTDLDDVCALGTEDAGLHFGIDLRLREAEGGEPGWRRELNLDGGNARYHRFQNSRLLW